MQNRIDQTFERLRTSHQSAFIAYIGAGDPTLAATATLALALEKAGVDILELGVPFSDPVADGIVNQLAAQRGLASGTTLQGVLDTVRAIRTQSQLPIVLYTYMNPVYRFGFREFLAAAEDAGVDGALLLDLPPDEDFGEFDIPSNVRRIRLIAPTTPPKRVVELARRAEGFVYYVSREGVTGERSTIASTLEAGVASIRAATTLPVAVGFGISTPDQAREVAGKADGVVVGSAIVKHIAEFGCQPDLAERVAEFVRPLAAATKH
ncbi:MAG: tryptophan synthase subunit alpha [Chthoniobacteraceae bacterium]